MTGAGRPRGRADLALPLLFLVAFLLRLTYLAEIAAKSPFFGHPFLDAKYYLEWARTILGGDVWGHEVFVRAPVYPYFLAAVGRIFGLGPWTIGISQALLGALTACLVARIGELAMDRRIGSIAGWISAFHGALIYWGGETLIETLFLFIVCGGILLIQRRLWFWAGLAVGLAAVTRPTGLVLVPAVPLLALAARARPRAALAGLLGALVFVGLVSFRNWQVGGDFVPVASHGGINFWTGNNERADGKIVVVPEGIQIPPEMRGQDNLIAISVLAAERDLGRTLRPSEVSSYWTRKGLAWIRAHPLDAAWLWLRKASYFWGGAEYTNNEDIYSFRRYSILLSALLVPLGPIYLPGALVMPLGLFGIWSLRARWREHLPLLLPLALYTLVVVAFFVSSRHRLPAVPLVLPFAVAGGHLLFTRRRVRDGLVFLGLFLLLGVNLHARPPATIAQFHRFEAEIRFERGQEAEAAGRFDEASLAYGEAARLAPAEFDFHYRRALSEVKRGRPDLALPAFEAAVRLRPEESDPVGNLAICYYSLGRMEEARAAAARAGALGAKLAPGFLEALRRGPP